MTVCCALIGFLCRWNGSLITRTVCLTQAVPVPTTTTSTTTPSTPKPTTTEATTTTSTPSSAPSTADPYFSHFDPRSEHASYKVKPTNSGPVQKHQDNPSPPFQGAQQRLEEMHREKVTRVMKDWSDLEEKYQDMRLADPSSAQSFKQRMTSRFQVFTVLSFALLVELRMVVVLLCVCVLGRAPNCSTLIN